jgi:hypothetical protein
MNTISFKYDIVIKEHFKKRYIERISDKKIYNNIINIIVYNLKDNNIKFLKLLIKIFLKWKNNKKNFSTEGKCLIIYYLNKIYYKISCKINIYILKDIYYIKIIFTTFMDVHKNDCEQINYLNNILFKYKNMHIKDNNYIIYFIPDNF